LKAIGAILIMRGTTTLQYQDLPWGWIQRKQAMAADRQLLFVKSAFIAKLALERHYAGGILMPYRVLI